METIQLQNGNVITTLTTTVTQADYIAAQNQLITQYQNNIVSLQSQIDTINSQIGGVQALIDQVS